MSKAFTKEDDDAGFSTPPSSSSIAVPEGVFRLTRTGRKRLEAHPDPRVALVLARADVLPPHPSPERAALGVTVHVRVADDKERTYRLVGPEEQALLGEGCSIQSPIGRALLGAGVGDVRELRTPRGDEEIEILALDGED